MATRARILCDVTCTRFDVEKRGNMKADASAHACRFSVEQKELRIIKRMEDGFIFVTIERNYIQGVNTFVLISLKNKF